ncbi:MAG: hypothetical protein PHZ24_09005 [Bacteroidales bacterium]|nr:hypothetical protein [Bacteroidales bacterium]
MREKVLEITGGIIIGSATYAQTSEVFVAISVAFACGVASALGGWVIKKLFNKKTKKNENTIH